MCNVSYLHPVVLDGQVEHVPCQDLGSVTVQPFFLRSQRATGFLCPGCRSEINYCHAFLSCSPGEVRGLVFSLFTGRSHCVCCPHCGGSVQFMFQNPPKILSMSVPGSPSVSGVVRRFVRRVYASVLGRLCRGASSVCF